MVIANPKFYSATFKLSPEHQLVHERFFVSEGLHKDVKGSFEFGCQGDQREQVEELLGRVSLRTERLEVGRLVGFLEEV